MSTKHKKSIIFETEVTDFENENNIYRCKRQRRNICSTSESDAELIEDNTQCNETWTSKNFTPKIHQFFSKNSGLKKKIGKSSKIIDYFELFICQELVEYIVDETNYYSAQKSNNNMDTQKITTLEEMYCFFALSLLMTRNKKLALHEYWSTDKYLRSSIFSEIMTRDRYLWILQMIHFTRQQGSADDRLYKISDIINMLRKSFCDTFYPYEKVCIDESLMLYKGRLSFKQYIPSKRNRFGIKSYILCDCKTGYVQDLIVYEGRSTITESDISGIGKSGAIVLSLLKPYLGQGHTLYTDNFYSSPALYNFLHDNCTNVCGTVKKRRQGMPKMEERLKKGEACFRATKNLLVIKWMDKKEVHMISSMHTVNFKAVSKYGGKQSVQKPLCVIDYNKSMGIVDKVDMVLSTVNSTRKSLKWYRKFFFHLMDICVWNAYCMYKHNRRETISMSKFHLALIKQIIEKYHHNSTGHQGRPADNLMRLTDRHFPTFCKPKNRRRRCVICSKNDNRTDSRYECKDCDVGLCIDPCFQIYHTELYY